MSFLLNDREVIDENVKKLQEHDITNQNDVSVISYDMMILCNMQHMDK